MKRYCDPSVPAAVPCALQLKPMRHAPSRVWAARFTIWNVPVPVTGALSPHVLPYVFPGIVKVGEPIQLNAEVNECGLPITGCVVTVSSLAPDGVVRNFTLHDDAAHGDGAADDGDYGHRFTHTAVEGTYRFTFRATGYSRDGEAVEREAVRSKYVEGRVPLVPPDGRGQDECCRKSQRWLQVLGVILLLILIVLVLIWLA